MSTTANSGPERPAATPALLQRIANRVRRRPAATDPALEEIAIIEASGRFDRKWYLQQHPDVAESGMDPIQHYVRHGAAEGRDPSQRFSTGYYLHNNPDVAASGMNPFRHYLEHGAAEGRPCQASGASRTASSGSTSVVNRDAGPPRVEMEAITRSGLFDTRYYLKSNPDVAASGMDPLLHFCRHGFRELRNPSATFDLGWYWLTYLPEDTSTNPLLHYVQEAPRSKQETRTVKGLSDDDKRALSATAARLLDPDQVHTPELYVRLGIALTRLKQWSDAAAAFARALAQQWDNPKVHVRMASVLAKAGKWWQAADSWRTATSLDRGHADWFFHLGEAEEQMKRFGPAADAYRQAIGLKPGDPQWHYRLGYALEKSGQQGLASRAYSDALVSDPSGEAKTYGIGVFHQARGYWSEAAEAYARELESSPAAAELHYRLGMAFDRCYRWQDAEQAYRNAIALKPQTPAWHARYAFVLERQRRFDEAAEAYACAATLSSKPVPYWWYRCGFVLALAGKYEKACRAYAATRNLQTLSPDMDQTWSDDGDAASTSLWSSAYFHKFSGEQLLVDALANDMTNATIHYQLGETRERHGDWEGAARAYSAAVDRSNEHQPVWYYRLGFALSRAGRYKDACDAFRETRILRSPHGLSEAAFAKATSIVQVSTAYVEYFNTLPLRSDVIMYESFNGNSMTCNPLALFRHLVKDPAYANYLHVWTLNDVSRLPEQYRALPNVIVVRRESDAYLRYLCTAAYLINNSGFPPYFIRKDGQKYLATWHGTPLKTLGKEQKYKFYDHKRTQRNFLQATHIISPNPFTTRILLDSYDIRPIFGGKLAETGYPRIDATLGSDDGRRATLRRALGIDDERPVVLYAPTWRGTLQDVKFDVDRLRNDIEQLAQRDCNLLFRGHSLMEDVLGEVPIGCSVVPATISTNDLLTIVEVLITDYSSTFFDFLATGRPVLYYIYDQDEYEAERGLYFSMEEMPGYKCRDIASLGRALDQALVSGVRDPDHLALAQKKFNAHDDGHATRRVIDFFFADDDTCLVDVGRRDKLRVLINGGSFQPNGITTSFLNLVNNIDTNRFHVSVAFSPNPIENDPAKMEYFLRMSKAVAAIPRYGYLPMTWEERWLRPRYEGGNLPDSPEISERMVDAFDREYARIFGSARFDVVIGFSGYDAFWTSILAMNRQQFRKAIYLHNDMYAEYKVKYPGLEQMFRLYRYADALVSVSDDTNLHNRKHLASRLGIPPQIFVSCENLQDPQRILELANEPVDAVDASLFHGGPVFINAGRLSPEKDHAKLIRAFARVHASHPCARLLILGLGPLRHDLIRLVGELGLSDCVQVLGFRPNPYAYMRHADCFVLSSNHEGQPMTLLEALILDMPIVATDIIGNRSVLGQWPELLVNNSESGLAEGMERYAAGVARTVHFDIGTYQEVAMHHFEQRVLNASESRSPSVDGLQP